MKFPKEWKKMLETIEQRAEVFDESQALSSVGGDREFLAEVVGLVQAAWPTLLAEIRRGMARGDLRAVKTTARLAGVASGYVSGKRAFLAARDLEGKAAAGDWEAAQQSMENLEREVELLQAYLSMLNYLE